MSAAPFSRSDRLVLDIATAYGRLGPRTHRQVVEFFGGDQSIAQAHELAQLLIATTTQDDLALILARLLAMADDEVGELELPAQPLLHPSRGGTPCLPLAAQHQRRRTDAKQGGH
jgi:hypothetical protein